MWNTGPEIRSWQWSVPCLQPKNKKGLRKSEKNQNRHENNSKPMVQGSSLNHDMLMVSNRLKTQRIWDVAIGRPLTNAFWKKFQESLIFLVSPHEGELLIHFKKRTLWTRFNTLVRNAVNETVVKVVWYNSFWTCWLLIDFFSLFPNILFTSSVAKSWVWWLQPFPELDDNFKGRKKQVSFLSQYGNILTLLSALKSEDGKEHTLEASFWCHNVIQSNWMNIHVF